MIKTCADCMKTLPLDLFTLLQRGRFGVDRRCRICKRARDRKSDSTPAAKKRKRAYKTYYEHTPQGYLSKAYGGMLRRVQGKVPKHEFYKGMNILPKNVFFSWAFKASNFMRLFGAFRASNWEHKKAPSVDRIDPAKGYDIDNIRYITVQANSQRKKHDKNG